MTANGSKNRCMTSVLAIGCRIGRRSRCVHGPCIPSERSGTALKCAPDLLLGGCKNADIVPNDEDDHAVKSSVLPGTRSRNTTAWAVFWSP
jgi:hypothetical protein